MLLDLGKGYNLYNQGGVILSYTATSFKLDINLKKIVTVHYFEYSKDYVFVGESHDFWEILYVDKGSVNVSADDRKLTLNAGEMIFHKPNEFHDVLANGKVAPNLIVISFVCNSAAMRHFYNRVIKITDAETDLLAHIISEARQAYDSPFDDPWSKKLTRSKNASFGSEQLIKIYLEQLLINLIRRENKPYLTSPVVTSLKKHSDTEIVQSIKQFLSENIYGNINFHDVCRYVSHGSTNVKMMFKKATGKGVMEYYRDLKIEQAKIMIREEDCNYTQISERLGYSSIHYFSRQFKKATGMTPSEYSASVKAKIKRHQK